MPSISVVSVLKNEAETMDKCYQSLQGIADEIVIGVDDSSTDNTLELAKKYASPGKLFEFTWENDFSKARNEAIKRADGQLIYIADGHEYVPQDEDPVSRQMAQMRHQNLFEQQILTPLSLLEVLKEKGLPEEFDVLCITLAMNLDAFGIPALFFLQPRIFKNHKGIKYESAVHNFLTGYDREGAMGSPEALLIHQMPEKREEKRKVQRKKMNITGLMEDIRRERKNPKGEQNGRPWFYLGNTYADLGVMKKALYWYKQYLPRSQFVEEEYQVLQQMSLINSRHLKEYKVAREFAAQSMLSQHKRAEPFVLLGEIAQEQEDWDQAIHWYSMSQQIAAPPTVMFCQGAVYSYMPCLKKMVCNAHMGHWDKALEEAEKALQWRPGDPQIIEQARIYQSKIKRSFPKDQNLLIIDRVGSFTEDLMQHWAQTYNVVRREDCDERYILWADVTWCEWCDENAINWSRQKWEGPLIVRLHSYESMTQMPGQVLWDNVDALVFVAEHIRDKVLEKWPEIAEKTEIHVIHNGTDPDKFEFRKRSHGNKVGCLGYMNHKKGTETLLELVRFYPEYDFIIGGEFQDETLAWFAQEFVEDLSNIHFKGWVNDEQRDTFFDEVDYLVSPSIIESFGFTIAEACLKGLKPLIRQRPGLKELWPVEWTWDGIRDFKRCLEGEYNSEEYRDWVLARYTLQTQLQKTDALINKLRGKPSHALPFATEPILNLQMITENIRMAEQPKEIMK